MRVAPIIVWLRQDLRLNDNPALAAAVAAGAPIVPLYLLDDETPGPWRLGGASRWWLQHSLASLDRSLRRCGARLILRRGRAETVIRQLVDELRPRAVFWNRCYEPYAVARDAAIKRQLGAQSIGAESFNAGLLFEPWTVRTQSGTPFKVFTPFWQACLAAPDPTGPGKAPRRLRPPDAWPASDDLAAWRLLPRQPDWAGGLRATWTPGEDGAQAQLDHFFNNALADYRDGRDRPDREFTSRLSPHLHFGEIGPRQVWHAARALSQAGARGLASAGGAFLRELGWREFCHHLLFHRPEMPTEPLRPAFARLAWRDDPAGLRAWQRGATGYPIVDAGMRQLWRTGWMHNRVRMIAASFLIKDLMIPWQRGEAWFWDTLVDADLANNAAGWQWVAGCGADAAPYFRIFNPLLQGEKFDPAGDYVRRYVPELAALPAKWIHRPFAAPKQILDAAGVRLGQTYPAPIVDHAAARDRALAAFAALRTAASDAP
ncbi:MAG: deoxyribodipyrimidine photo-lyase [Alphaproteobacteria bacterium]